ncbi:hypothetical protein NDU88_001419 [Pleurodeles waltl]|uniref:Uncharacterized protein n=1 Tax=Pleurodeles waltl TaxID=8319 RepID=A0AAV7R7W7_PLEWA|nr:hypothetical protein NDU88_001419 [Pleurodeles waltl]
MAVVVAVCESPKAKISGQKTAERQGRSASIPTSHKEDPGEAQRRELKQDGETGSPGVAGAHKGEELATEQEGKPAGETNEEQGLKEAQNEDQSLDLSAGTARGAGKEASQAQGGKKKAKSVRPGDSTRQGDEGARVSKPIGEIGGQVAQDGPRTLVRRTRGASGELADENAKVMREVMEDDELELDYGDDTIHLQDRLCLAVHFIPLLFQCLQLLCTS